jgi:hypothetical protein
VQTSGVLEGGVISTMTRICINERNGDGDGRVNTCFALLIIDVNEHYETSFFSSTCFVRTLRICYNAKFGTNLLKDVYIET